MLAPLPCESPRFPGKMPLARCARDWCCPPRRRIAGGQVPTRPRRLRRCVRPARSGVCAMSS